MTRTCSLCENKHWARGWCGAHYVRWRRYGDPLGSGVIGRPKGSRTAPGKVHGRSRGDQAGYSGVHMRLKRDRGPARDYLCPCGAQAAEWSFDTPGGGWSVDLSRYTALCHRCHRLKDAHAHA